MKEDSNLFKSHIKAPWKNCKVLFYFLQFFSFGSLWENLDELEESKQNITQNISEEMKSFEEGERRKLREESKERMRVFADDLKERTTSMTSSVGLNAGDAYEAAISELQDANTSLNHEINALKGKLATKERTFEIENEALSKEVRIIFFSPPFEELTETTSRKD